MLTLRRFKELADAYGADIQRWPEAFRADALQILRESEEAHIYLKEAETLDLAIFAASEKADAALWQGRPQNISLTRLEAGVAAEIAAQAARQVARKPKAPPRWRDIMSGGMTAQGAVLSLQNIEIATCGVIAVAMGLWLGTMYAATFTGVDQGSILTLLQPAPLHLLF